MKAHLATPKLAGNIGDVSPESVRRQMERILASPGFARGERLGSFLRFVVEETLQGRSEQLKETVIGTSVYGKEADYDPKQTAVVRVEAAKLRARLGEYYAGAGLSDPVVIEIPKGSYVPVWDRPKPPPAIGKRTRWLVWGTIAVLSAIGIAVWLKAPSRQEFSSIAVVPFVDMSRDHSDEYFSDGLTEQIIDALAKIDKLRVISQTSSFALKGKQLGASEIREKLNVDAIVEGSVRREGDQLRIVAQFIRTKDDRHLWSHTYEREMKDVFAIQDEVARSIVETLRGKNIADHSSGVGKRYTENLEVYNLYLKGRYFWDKRDGSKARSFFEQAIAKDPKYAPAYAGIAQCYQRFSDGFTPREQQAKIKEFAEKALELDPDLAEAHASLGMWSSTEYDWVGAEKQFRRAIELNPSFALAHQWYARGLLSDLGRMSDAVREMKRAEELDPLSADVASLVSDLLRKAGRLDEALAQALKAVELDPNSRRAHGSLAQAYLDKKMYSEGIKEMEICCAKSGPVFVAYAYAVAGRKNDATRLLNQVLEQSQRSYVSPGFLAQAYAALGDKDRAFEYLEKAYTDHDLNLGQSFYLIEFADVRADPRYAALRRKLGLPN